MSAGSEQHLIEKQMWTSVNLYAESTFGYFRNNQTAQLIFALKNSLSFIYFHHLRDNILQCNSFIIEIQNYFLIKMKERYSWWLSFWVDNFKRNQRQWGKNLFVLRFNFLLLGPVPPHPHQTDKPKMLWSNWAVSCLLWEGALWFCSSPVQRKRMHCWPDRVGNNFLYHL